MPTTARTSQQVTDAIRSAAKQLGHTPSRSEFFSNSGMNNHQLLSHFDSWNDAVVAAGFEPNTSRARIEDCALIEDWGMVVRRLREIPTAIRYRREGEYSADVLKRRFGAWVGMPEVFRDFANGKPEWSDVVALLPVATAQLPPATPTLNEGAEDLEAPPTHAQHSKFGDRPTYGNPIDFRGLRHEPANEQGVVFLFGMIANELGYMVEVVQTGYPDCEAKRQVGPNKWQRVRIEFEFESRNFRDHGHSPSGCDVIVCWRHNWPECPPGIEVVELSATIRTLSKSQD